MTIEEIQDALTEFENRISYLENSQVRQALPLDPSDRLVDLECRMTEIERLQERPIRKRLSAIQWDKVQQLEGEVSYLHKKFEEYAKSQKKKKRKYNVYSP